MAVNSVTVKADFCVQHLEVAIGHDDQRVDFQHLHVLLGEGTVQIAKQGDHLFDLSTLEAQFKCNAATVIRLIAGCWVDFEAQDFFWGRGCNLFDVHAAFGRCNDRNTRCRAVNQQSQVHFGFDVRTIFDVDAVDLLACWTGLVCDQSFAQHLFCLFGCFFYRFGKANTAFFACFGFFEAAFAAATCVDLRLNYPERAIKFTCCGFCVFSLQYDTAVRNRRAVAAQERFGLIFMDVHRVSLAVLLFTPTNHTKTP